MNVLIVSWCRNELNNKYRQNICLKLKNYDSVFFLHFRVRIFLCEKVIHFTHIKHQKRTEMRRISQCKIPCVRSIAKT